MCMYIYIYYIYLCVEGLLRELRAPRVENLQIIVYTAGGEASSWYSCRKRDSE